MHKHKPLRSTRLEESTYTAVTPLTNRLCGALIRRRSDGDRTWHFTFSLQVCKIDFQIIPLRPHYEDRLKTLRTRFKQSRVSFHKGLLRDEDEERRRLLGFHYRILKSSHTPQFGPPLLANHCVPEAKNHTPGLRRSSTIRPYPFQAFWTNFIFLL